MFNVEFFFKLCDNKFVSIVCDREYQIEVALALQPSPLPSFTQTGPCSKQNEHAIAVLFNFKDVEGHN